MASNYKTVMFDPHAAVGSRQEVIDKGIALKKGGFTDFVQLIQDAPKVRPSTILYAPILGITADSPIIGYFGGVFSWDTMLTTALPSYIRGLNLVIATGTTSFTLSLGKGVVTVLGKGDLHESEFSKYGRHITDDLSLVTSAANVAEYTFTVYPTQELYLTYVTNIPTTACAVVVCLIVLIVIVLASYDYLIKSREKTLLDAAEEATNTSNMVRALLPSFLSRSMGTARMLGSILNDLPVHKVRAIV
jgi:hypothetical protein